MKDSFYTEEASAGLLAATLGDMPASRIADFSCGDGALLVAAYLKWPSSSFYGVDIDPHVAESIASRMPAATFVHADFLTANLEDTPASGLFDVILLNPPFSCPGSQTVESVINDRPVRCSRAMAFLAKSLRSLAPKGVVAAILPLSCIFSDKDAEARKVLTEAYNFDVIPTATTARFHGCSVNTVIVHVSSRANRSAPTRCSQSCSTEGDFALLRGGRPDPDSAGFPELPPFVHTTELNSNKVSLARFPAPHSRDRTVVGPAMLIPRVGRPNKGKVCLLEQGVRVRISDCVIAVQYDTADQTIAAYESILLNWLSFSTLYRGTCAPYTTLSRVKSFLISLAANEEAVAA